MLRTCTISSSEDEPTISCFIHNAVFSLMHCAKDSRKDSIFIGNSFDLYQHHNETTSCINSDSDIYGWGYTPPSSEFHCDDVSSSSLCDAKRSSAILMTTNESSVAVSDSSSTKKQTRTKMNEDTTNSHIIEKITNDTTNSIIVDLDGDYHTEKVNDDDNITPSPSISSSGNDNKKKKSVSFSKTLGIRTHELIIGDHPCCEDGLPIGLGWKYSETELVDIDSFYERRFNQLSSFNTDSGNNINANISLIPRRSRKKLRLKYYERIDLLKRVTGRTLFELLQRNRDYLISCDF